jgi:nucleotidyltransferase-like protein
VTANGAIAARAAWRYQTPTAAFAAIAGFLAFYAGLMDRCTVDGETVTPQPGGFYGGWITAGIVGPFKGEPGSMGW